MNAKQLLIDLEFHDSAAFAQPLLVDQNSRILRWMLKPGQEIAEHKVPDSPFYVIILQGRGMFAGRDRQEQEYGPSSMLTFEPGEPHSVRALDEELVFISFLQGSDSMRPDRTGGEIGRE
jgi:quercetin dioxygenase-like cupin family protein